MFTEKNIHLKEVDSTNTYAISLKNTTVFKEGLVVNADFQTAGKGQRGSYWESENGKNILLTAVFEPDLKLHNQFKISKIVAVSIVEFLEGLGLRALIKWPNDILIDKQKVAGVLVQNMITKNTITHSVIGIGLNVNQLKFLDYNPTATSLKLKLDSEFVISDLRKELLKILGVNLVDFKNGKMFDELYHNHLFMKDKIAVFESSNQKFNGIIKGVSANGLLQIETEDSLKQFDLKQVKMLF
ncbi:MAG: biotin--[acetyl-CoA-carboxylase] ligase [Flavobacteriales bacterium]|nr:biotin--[acetyl-CoA-carboxylase] ligase [Flavobacteriales bacterium]